ncbi:hypothetical protein BJX64DRAFT_252211 [Aspergillus heterothallicus]
MEYIDPIPQSVGDSDDEICYTPSAATTHASFPESATAHDLPTYAASTGTALASVPPHKDATFVIRDRSTGLVIALEDGKLGLYESENDTETVGARNEKAYQHSRSSHWKCVENEHLYFGFRNSVSGEYIGHNGETLTGRWRFWAERKHHKWWEWFTAQHQPDGGYVLLVKHDHAFRSMKAGGADGRELLVADKGEKGTAWDFIKIR